MKSLQVITPVKDSIDFTLETIRAVLSSETSVPLRIPSIMISVQLRIRYVWNRRPRNLALIWLTCLI